MFGSAGDLFPLVPIILELRDRGVDVRCAAPRSLGLYLRLIGIPSIGLGDGSELGVLRDQRIFTTRFDGWSSWRRTLVHYVGPALRGDSEQLERLFQSWLPEVVVTSGFAVAARIVAERHGVPTVNLSIYPQHESVDPVACRHFARPFARSVGAVAGTRDDSEMLRLMFGTPSEVLLHDPALLGSGPSARVAVGFPYWDGVSNQIVDSSEVDEILRRPGKHVLVTLGSFVGLAQQRAWQDAADAVGELTVSALFVGAKGSWARSTFGGRDDIRCIGFMPLSAVVGRFDAVIHHGGIGTMMSALRAARPAVVLPQAFDQPMNARLLERAGGGLDGSARPLTEALDLLLENDGAVRRTRAITQELRPTAAAVEAACSATVRALTST